MRRRYRSVRWLLPALILAGALLAGCATPGPRPGRMPAATPPPTPPAIPDTMPATSSPAPAPRDADFWQALRDDFAFVDCDIDTPEVMSWTRRYSEHPKRLQASLSRALPRLRYIAALLHDAGIPGEFAMLPWVESSFRVLHGRGNGPAGLWQIMPATGRGLGLRIDQRYDARLDLHESTLAAARLLQRYDDTFHDWRLADMAYNTGMYRVKKLLSARDTALPEGGGVPDIGTSEITRQHLAKLMAIACLVQNPERHGVQLPTADDAPVLHRMTLSDPLPLPLAARLAGIDETTLRGYNASYLDASLPARHLLLPGNATVARFRDVYARLERQQWTLWQRVELRRPATLADMVDDDGARDLLARINRAPDATAIDTGTRLWLPASLAAALPAATGVVVAAQPPAHRVVAGDNLWKLARRFHLRVSDLRSWNGLRSDLLHLGQMLRLVPPDDFPAAPGKALN